MAMAEEIAAVSKTSADHGPEASARLPRSRRLRHTTLRVEVPGIVALRKVAAVVIKVAPEEVFIALLRNPAGVDRVAAVLIAVVADPVGVVVATAAAADPAAAVVATAEVADLAAAVAIAVAPGPTAQAMDGSCAI